MSINRRKFTQMALLSSASYAATSGIFFPKPAEAYSVDFLLKNLSARNVLGDLLQFATAKIIGEVASPPTDPTTASVIRAADNKFLKRDFTKDKTKLALTGASSSNTWLWGRQKQERLGPNIGFGFVQKYLNDLSSATISGPTMAGIHATTKILAAQKMSPNEIAGSLIPVRSQFDDFITWEGDNDPEIGTSSRPGFNSYRTTLGEVSSRYDLIKPGSSGYGEVQLTIEADGQPRRDIIVRVKFSVEVI